MDWVNQIVKVNNKFRFQLFGKGIENLNQCYINMETYDPENKRVMGQHKFNLFLNSFGVFLSTQQIRFVKEAFHEGDQICYLDFIQNIRNQISPKRQAVVDHAFRELSNGQVISIAHLLSIYDVKNHPHVRCLIKTQQKTFQDFQRAILSRSADRVNINESEFKQYFLDVNACVPVQREEYYIDIILNGLRLNDYRVTIDRLRQMEVLVFEKVRQRTYMKKDEGLKAQTAFRFFDMEDKGYIDYQRFLKGIGKLGCGFSPKQMRALFEKHAGSDLLMSYEQMCGLLFEMSSGIKDNTNPIYELSKKQGMMTSPGMSKKIT